VGFRQEAVCGIGQGSPDLVASGERRKKKGKKVPEKKETSVTALPAGKKKKKTRKCVLRPVNAPRKQGWEKEKGSLKDAVCTTLFCQEGQPHARREGGRKRRQVSTVSDQGGEKKRGKGKQFPLESKILPAPGVDRQTGGRYGKAARLRKKKGERGGCLFFARERHVVFNRTPA